MRRLVSRQLAMVVMLLSVMLTVGLSCPINADSSCALPVNSIEAENCNPGNPPGEWDISGAGDPTIQGFAGDISVNRGETVSFKVLTDASSYRLDIYRIGYYGGSGARKIATVMPSVTLPQNQQACITDVTTRLTDCGNWAESASWVVPQTATSGVYIAKIVRLDTGGASHIIFIVRDDAGGSDLLFKTSDTTWQAYNSYGLGFIEYPDYGYPSQKATKASYNRPFLTRSVNNGLGAYNWFFQSEYPLIRWLEANGYNVSYFTSVDADRSGAEILKHKAFLSVGHDEYWSGQMRTNVENARDAGVNLAFFSGNEIYRKIRWENSVDGSGTPYRTMVCYNESNAPAPIDPVIPAVWTGTWRNQTFSPPLDGGRAENALSGTLFTVSGGPSELGISLEVPQANGRMRFWRNTAAASLEVGQKATLGDRIVGYEFDEDIDNGFRPAGLIQLSSTFTPVNAKLLGNNVNIAADVYLPGSATHAMTLYRSASGALVFSAGTVQWSWGLDGQHDNGPSVPDQNLRQATVNILADMGLQPVTLQAGLIAAAASTDKSAPVAVITSPVSGASIPAGTQVTIIGSASDSGGGVVGGVEVSTDGGISWHPASGRESWSYFWSPTVTGAAVISTRAVDDSGNVQTAPTSVSIVVTTAPANSYSIWPGTALPVLVDGGADSPVELGVKFRSDLDGFVTGIRFYKASSNSGTHTGSLWTGSGTRLATATFSNETASGWQQVNFTSPVAIAANTVYVASCHVEAGHYSADINYFTGQGADSAPLHALASGVSGDNGVYAYGSTSNFPNQSWNNANYWVDVVLSVTSQDPGVTPLFIATTTLPDAILNVPYAVSLAAGGGTGPYVWSLASGALPSGLTLNSSSGTIDGIATASGSFSVTVKAADSGTPQQSATTALNISVTAQLNYSLWGDTVVPDLVDAGPDSAVELGVKFSAGFNGFIHGIRFYKASTNTGSHVGNLWTSGGTLLASALFTGESSSGWQQVLFASPVAISSNTVYVASYHTNFGHYSASLSYFSGKAVDNPPLYAPADGVSGNNGVFAYGVNSTFPNQGWKSSNYWVDVLFSATPPPDTSAPMVTAFSLPPISLTLPVDISSFIATDNVAVTGYMVSESAAVPSAVDSRWSAIPPASYTCSSIGSKTLYGWARDAAGNVSASLSATVTIPPFDTVPPLVTAFTMPASSATLAVAISSLSASDNVAVTGYLVTESAIAPSLAASGWSSSAPVSYSFTTTGNKTLYAWARDAAGNVSPGKSAAVTLTSDGPILLVSSASNPFSSYYAEIMRAEGFNAFAEADITTLTSQLLAAHDVVVLGEIPVTATQVALLSDWVSAGGKLIAMRPDKKLAALLGLTDQGASLSDAYLLVATSSGPGAGIVDQTIQFHGTADLYGLADAASLANLYADSKNGTSNPAVSLKNVGANGGQAAAFTYDLARSIVYTRQGNPAWSGQDRDGFAPIRANDLFFGAASLDRQSDWVNLDKVAIPQADEQQRLLANLIVWMNQNKKPLPRFWYFPRSLPAVVVMTGDDHGHNGTAGRFESYKEASPLNCSVDNWECIRGTSYMYTTTPLTAVQALGYTAAGFEVALHVSTNCADWTPSTLNSFYATQLEAWKVKYTDVPGQTTNRTHCIVWSDYASQPLVELAQGIRLDTTYYYYPSFWVSDRPGFFTGSGMPMRFADSSGNLINVFQAATQLTDESGQSYPTTIDMLLDRAIGAEGYYGVFIANMHTDESASSGSEEVVASAKARGIPVISARQLLKWLDGRNSSSFSSVEWDGATLGFVITASPEAVGLSAMTPIVDGQAVTAITCNGAPVAFETGRIKGIQYSRFPVQSGACQVLYAPDVSPPVVSEVSPASGAAEVSTVPQVSAVFSELVDAATLTASTFELRDPLNILVPTLLSYNMATKKALLEPVAPLASSTNYTATIKGGIQGVKDLAGNRLAGDFSWVFSTTAASNGSYSIWPGSTLPDVVDAGPDSAVELGVKFRSDISGYVAGVRFYKASTNSGLHTGSLWTSSGTLLATAPFSAESPSGWQQVLFPVSVPISANTVYVASYHTTTGHYSSTLNYFKNSGVDSPPLHAPANGVSGFNGVFAYGSASNFPNQGWYSSNYWVDVLFSANLTPTLAAITLTPGNQRLAIGASQPFTATGTYSDGSTRNLTSQVVWHSANSSVATITGSGVVTAVALGITSISASMDGTTGSTNVTATDQIGLCVPEYTRWNRYVQSGT